MTNSSLDSINPSPNDTVLHRPTREELQAELLEIPESPEAERSPEPSSLDQILAFTLGYIRGKRGADLVAVMLVGSGARRALTPHSDLNFIALIKGQDEGEETVRVSDRVIDIRYRNYRVVEQELPRAPRLPPLLRKARVLFEHESIGSRLVEKAAQRFRQGPPPAGLHEKIRLKAQCVHALGKAEDLLQQPPTAQYLLERLGEELLQAFFRLRGFWLTTPSQMLRFARSRDAAFGELMERYLTAPAVSDRVAIGRELVDLLFKDIPNPARID